jgi:hypothetical protein
MIMAMISVRVSCLANLIGVVVIICSCASSSVKEMSRTQMVRHSICIESLIYDEVDTILILPTDSWQRINYDRVGGRCYSYDDVQLDAYRFVMKVNSTIVDSFDVYESDLDCPLWRLREASKGAYESYRLAVERQDSSKSIDPNPDVLLSIETCQHSIYMPLPYSSRK